MKKENKKEKWFCEKHPFDVYYCVRGHRICGICEDVKKGDTCLRCAEKMAKNFFENVSRFV